MADTARAQKVADRIQVTCRRDARVARSRTPPLGFVTITDVRVSGDPQHATIFYTVFARSAARRDRPPAGVDKGILRS